ncbi:ribonuclease III domain-containing protein [Clostridium sp. MD294]|uniref:Mini-ribonuclease 3 n=1 Tax=Clostridium sp. MD294 TaxID=97138 RepID=UPI0002CCB570|nr:ribonuclease III domain-containing protein [Clostridium sp. MD294]NDO46246.1 ribonuclease III [Clostridium sp. MD294]USF30085.1 Mini-ribonuclease 3 [Clostridium sp. MD294]
MEIQNVKALLIEGVQGGIKPNEVSSLALAYIGDAIYEIFVRTLVLSKGNAPVNKLHKQSKEYVNAKGQAEMYKVIAECFTEEEKAVFRRGRNAKSYTTPKNMDIADYRHATGLEALFGYLYLKGDMKRAIELFEKGVSAL